MKPTALPFDPAARRDLHRTSREGAGRDPPSAPAARPGAESDATESSPPGLAGGITAETLRDAIASHLAPLRQPGPTASVSRPDLAILSSPASLDGLLRDRATDTESSAENG